MPTVYDYIVIWKANQVPCTIRNYMEMKYGVLFNDCNYVAYIPKEYRTKDKYVIDDFPIKCYKTRYYEYFGAEIRTLHDN